MAKRVEEKSADTLRQRVEIARYGQAARYPLCQAALSLWTLDVDWLNALKASFTIDRVLEDCESNISTTKALIAQLRQERKSKDVNSARELLQKLNELRSKALTMRENRDGTSALRALREVAEKAFAKESLVAVRAGDFAAFKALERSWKRWKQPDIQPDHRTLAVLKLLSDKAVKQAWDKGGAAAGFTEAAFGGSNRLSDDVHWPRFTANELHKHLVAMRTFSNGEEQLHQVRRLAKKLGIRLLPDKRGRKPKINKAKKRVR